MKNSEISPQHTAMDRPHRRASAKIPNTMAICCSSPKMRSVAREMPNSL